MRSNAMDRNSADKYHLIAQQRAEQFKTARQDLHCTRARSQDGHPVSYKKVKERANITRQSRVMSDPEIPGTLVILNAKGLFQGKNGNLKRQSNPESSTASVNVMDHTDINRPLFFDPSLRSKDTKVSDLKKKFEAVQSDITEDKHGITESDFLNPLHKVNQDYANSNKTAKKRVKKKLEEALNNNASTTKSPSALKVNEIHTHSITTKESEVKTEMPTRPPPRAFMQDPHNRLRGESDPMPFDENTLSRVHVFPQESLKEEVQEESSPPLVSETEILVVVSADGCDGTENDDDDSDDFDTDEWDSDFDDDDEEEDELQKRDSQSSHGSSCDAEPLVSNYHNFSFTLTCNFLINSYMKEQNLKFTA